MTSELIEVSTMYGAKTREPAVVLKWGSESGQLTVNDARKHALRVLEAAEAAESDAFIADWMRGKVGADGRIKDEQLDLAVALTLRDFRQARALRNEKEGGV